MGTSPPRYERAPMQVQETTAGGRNNDALDRDVGGAAKSVGSRIVSSVSSQAGHTSWSPRHPREPPCSSSVETIKGVAAPGSMPQCSSVHTSLTTTSREGGSSARPTA